MTAKEFYDKHIGKGVDIDHSCGIQCVDLFKAFTKENYNTPDYTTGNGYASGLWIYRKTKPYYKYFVDASVKTLQDGDWVIWGKCKACPDSHVAMYYKGKFFGQNQAGKRYATLIKITTDGVIGVLRPKMYIKPVEKVDQILHKGSKVVFNGVFKVNELRGISKKYKNGAVGCYATCLGKPIGTDDWIPCGPLAKCDSKGKNVNYNAVFKKGDYWCSSKVFTVKAVELPTKKAKNGIATLEADGVNFRVDCKVLKEV